MSVHYSGDNDNAGMTASAQQQVKPRRRWEAPYVTSVSTLAKAEAKFPVGSDNDSTDPNGPGS